MKFYPLNSNDRRDATVPTYRMKQTMTIVGIACYSSYLVYLVVTYYFINGVDLTILSQEVVELDSPSNCGLVCAVGQAEHR